VQDEKTPRRTNLLLTDEAATVLRSHPETIRDACREGKIKACKIGKTWRIAIEEVERVAREGL
jgi:excisionase family DNA binding protein